MKAWLTSLTLLLYLALKIVQNYNSKYLPELINSYLADFLFSPIFLSITRWVIIYIKNDSSYKMSYLQILIITIIFSLCFEYILPMTYNIHHSDLYDVISYFIGAFCYILLRPRKII
jgi:hypothetical protein